MTDDNSNNNLVDISDNLDEFESAFYSKDDSAPEVEDTEDDALATDTDTDAPEGDDDAELEESEEDTPDEFDDEPDADEQDEEDEPEDKPEDKGKRKKSDYQSRINELTRARREAERREALLLNRLEALEAERVARSPRDSATEQVSDLPQGAPSPDAVNDKGESKYPLGEFDPLFIRDFTKFTVEQETKAIQERQAQETANRQKAAEQEQLKTAWSQKLDAAEDDIPEIREHIEDLVDTFQNLDPSYGEYLAMTIMQCENGPAIMEYLSQNIGEAQDIVASGAAAATRKIGRLDAKLEKASVRPVDDEKRNKKPSGAAPPPKALARGSRGQQHVRPDTEDLSAFEREFYSKK